MIVIQPAQIIVAETVPQLVELNVHQDARLDVKKLVKQLVKKDVAMIVKHLAEPLARQDVVQLALLVAQMIVKEPAVRSYVKINVQQCATCIVLIAQDLLLKSTQVCVPLVGQHAI